MLEPKAFDYNYGVVRDKRITFLVVRAIIFCPTPITKSVSASGTSVSCALSLQEVCNILMLLYIPHPVHLSCLHIICIIHQLYMVSCVQLLPMFSTYTTSAPLLHT